MVAAFIPVRGGSKSIPLKNIRTIAGKPLVYWTAKAASDCKYIDKVYIATDSEVIKSTVESFNLPKVEVIGRSAESASDTASTEFAMLEFAEKYDFDNLYLIQATSPLLTSEDLDGGYELFKKENTDSVLSVVRQKRFHWAADENGIAHPTNYDVFHRPRRQEFDGYLVENGAFYITSKKNLMESRNRVSGNIRAYEMDESTYFEIDEPSDWIIIEHQLEKKQSVMTEKDPDDYSTVNDTAIGRNIPEIWKKASDIKLFLMDCDGVLTDGGMYYSESGDELKRFNTQDGFGLRLLQERGIKVGIITGENRELNRRRAEKLRMDIVKQGIHDKISVIRQLCEEYKVTPDNILYIGDDLNDLEVVKNVGIGCTVANARPEVKAAAGYVSPVKGGNGAVRDITDRLLKAL